MLESVKGDEAARILMSGLPPVGAGRSAGSPVAVGSGVRGVELIRQLAHCFSQFPYENISKIIKAANSATLAEAMRLPTEVVTDHIERNFGGTCFSLTFLFERVLKSFGFDCYKVMADMNSGRNVHCLVVVKEAGVTYMVDPGYALYEVVALPERGTQRVRFPHAAVEVAADADTHDGAHDGAHDETRQYGQYGLWTEDASGRKWRYTFRDTPVADQEFEGYWLESFGKPTLHNICITRMTPRGHLYFRKDFFKFTSPTAIEKRKLKREREREKFIEQEFGIGGEWVEIAQKLLDEKRALNAGRALDERRAANWPK